MSPWDRREVHWRDVDRPMCGAAGEAPPLTSVYKEITCVNCRELYGDPAQRVRCARPGCGHSRAMHEPACVPVLSWCNCTGFVEPT